jgi:alpha-tubulin suppressor-like RCC1 family protein
MIIVFYLFLYYYLFLFLIESLFLFGSNEFNQLGIQEVEKVSTLKVDFLKNIKNSEKKFKKISCGSNHSLILIEGIIRLKNIKIKFKKNRKRKKFIWIWKQ